MKKLIFVYLLLIVSMAVLAGCGGEYTGIHRNEDTTLSSGGAVSGEAVSVAAVDAEEKTTVKYANRNSTNLYTPVEAASCKTFVQRRLDGKPVKELKPASRGADDIFIQYVDDAWMYYTRWSSENAYFIDLWRAPVNKKGGCDDVKFEQEEKVLAIEGGIFNEIYVVDNYIYYTRDLPKTACRKYDMKEGTQVTMSEGLPVQEMGRSWWCGYCNGSMFLGRDSEQRTDQRIELYVQDIYTDQFRLLDEEKGSSYWNLVTNETQAYYSVRDEIKRYRSGMENPETYISGEQLKEAAKAAGFNVRAVEIEYLFLDDTTLYILAEEAEGNAWQMLFSCGLKGEAKPEFEKKFFEKFEQELRALEFDDEIEEGIRFVDGKCLLYSWEYDDEVCFDLATGEVKQVTGKDAEYWWRYW